MNNSSVTEATVMKLIVPCVQWYCHSELACGRTESHCVEIDDFTKLNIIEMLFRT